MHKIDDDERKRVLNDGERLRVALIAMDATPKAVVAADGDPFSLHRPGFRVSTDQALQDARERAYQEAKHVAEQAWKSPQRREQDVEEAALVAHDAVVSADDAQKIRDAAWHRLVERMCSAWKNP